MTGKYVFAFFATTAAELLSNDLQNQEKTPACGNTLVGTLEDRKIDNFKINVKK